MCIIVDYTPAQTESCYELSHMYSTQQEQLSLCGKNIDALHIILLEQHVTFEFYA